MVSGNLNVEHLLDTMTQNLNTLITYRNIEDPLIVGIRTGGVWIAEHLHRRLGLQSPMGMLDISFYRDDFTRNGLNPKVLPSNLPCATEDRHIILVDDVIMSGRTIRAAMNELFDYGRPASITLVTMIDLQHREIPIQPDVAGDIMTLGPDQQIKLNGPAPLVLEIRQRNN